MEQNVLQSIESSNETIKKCANFHVPTNLRDDNLVQLILVPISELKTLAEQFKRTREVYSRIHVSLRENDSVIQNCIDKLATLLELKDKRMSEESVNSKQPVDAKDKSVMHTPQTKKKLPVIQNKRRIVVSAGQHSKVTKCESPKKHRRGSAIQKLKMLNDTERQNVDKSQIPSNFCKVCGDNASTHVYYGGQSCAGCRAFFRRHVKKLVR